MSSTEPPEPLPLIAQRHHRSGLVGLLSLALIALIATAGGDLEFSRRLVAPDSPWASFGQRFGELPGIIVGLAALGVVFSNAEYLKTWQRAALTLVSLASVPLLGLVLGHIAFPSRVSIPLPWQLEEWTILGTSALTVLAIAAWLWRTNRFESPRVRRFARVSLAMMLLGNLLVVTPLKFVWGRVRYRDLTPDAGEYTAWWIPNGYTDNFSFPSGHTALAWMVLPLLLLVPRQSRVTRFAIASALVFWALFVSLSRVRIGAHYVSDVAFSTCLQVGLFLWFSRHPQTLREFTPAQTSSS